MTGADKTCQNYLDGKCDGVDCPDRHSRLELVNGIEEQQDAEEMKVVNTLMILLSVVSRKLMKQKRRPKSSNRFHAVMHGKKVSL